MSFLDKLKNKIDTKAIKPEYTLKQETEYFIYKFDLSNEIDADSIVKTIVSLKEKYPKPNFTNVFAWHTDFFAHKKTNEFDKLIEVIGKKVKLVAEQSRAPGKFDVSCHESWAIIYDKIDNRAEWHTHGDADYSIAYYAKVPVESSPVVFKNMNLGLNQDVDITTETNTLLVFPGHVLHKVPNLTNTDARIVFAANFYIYRQEI